jgi:broad specificity phosphatase PhoE
VKLDLLLVRHGHDLLLPTGERILSEIGRQQARVLAERLSRTSPDELYCSTSIRAVQTASELAAAWGIEAILDPRLEEISNNRKDSLAGPPRERTEGERYEGVETWGDFLVRVSAFISQFCSDRKQDRRIAVVTHRGVFDAMHEVLTGARRRIELDVAHTGVTAWHHRPGAAAGTWLLRWHNDLGCLSAETPGVRNHSPRNW